MRRPTIYTALLICAVVVLATVLTGCGGSTGAPPPPTGTSSGSAPAAGGATVTEQNFAFNPASVTVKVGDTVTFTNQDSAAHEVLIDGQDLGSQAQGASVTWKATKAGTFPFSCKIHPSMTGQVTVQ
jgi:plastocyanin